MRSSQLSKDISPAAIKKAVISTTLQKPMTVYPAALGLLGGFTTLLFGAGPIGLTALIAGGGVTLMNWLFEYYVKGDKHANEFVRVYRQQLEKRRVEALKSLEQDLKDINNDHALNQVKLFRNKYDNFHSILDRKLDETELTYNRYLSIAEQVFLNGLDNLENAAISLKSISAIDYERIEKEIQKLDQNDTQENRQRMNELKTRLDLRANQLERVSDLLLVNERALTQLDHVSTKIANIDTQQNRAHLDMEDAMKELSHLISRAEEYSN